MTEMKRQISTEPRSDAALKAMRVVDLQDLADALRCPDGMRNPVNSVPLPIGRKALVAFIKGMWQRRADSEAIERQARF